MNKFGTEITTQDIVDDLSFFDSWEDRYKYIIDLGKELPSMDEKFHTDANLVRGCQSQVWLVADREGQGDDAPIRFEVDSDAFIVRGLLGVVLAAYNCRTPQQILDFDIEAYFDELNLLKHLSPTRGNGLRAMVQRIRRVAAESSANP